MFCQNTYIAPHAIDGEQKFTLKKKTKYFVALIMVLILGGAVIYAPKSAAENKPAIEKETTRYYLELFVNGRSSGHIAVVDYKDIHYFVSSEDLLATGISTFCLDTASVRDRHQIAVDTLDHADIHYEQSSQKLMISVPPVCLPVQELNTESMRKRYEPLSSFGAVFNYDLYTQKTKHNGSSLNALGGVHLFADSGFLSHTGVYRHTFDGASSRDDGYMRYDTTLQYADDKNIRIFEAGDVVTRPVGWSNAVRIGGVQFSRDFSLRPDIITYPLPSFSGQAGVPSSLELFIDGYKQYESQVDPGPFSLNNAPILTGAGEAMVVTTDALGRQVTTSISFYVTPELLKQGMSDYTLSMGALRKHYGRKNFAYSEFAVDGSYRYGLNDHVTVELHTEGASDLYLGGAGLITRLGNFGVLNTSYAHSYYGRHPLKQSETGGQAGIGYQFDARSFSFGAKYIYRDKKFRDLSAIDPEMHLARELSQITAGVPLGQWGNLNVGYFMIKPHNSSRTELVNLSWNRSFGRWGTVFAAVNHSNQNDNASFSLQWTIPIGGKQGEDWGNFSAGVERNANNEMTYRTNYSRAVPSKGGWGWSVGYDHQPDGDDYRQMQLNWRNNMLNLQGGVYGISGQETVWGDISGSLIWMDKSTFATNMVHDAFVVVSTDGVENIPVKYENSLIGETNKRGHLLVPQTPAYYPAKYEIDPMNLPFNLKTPIIEQRIAIKRNSGYLLRFPVEHIVPANIILVDDQYNYVPMGSLVVLEDGQRTYVGWDGMVYLENALAHQSATVYYAQGEKRCTVDLSQQQMVPEEVSNTVITIGPLVCQTKGVL